jgi:hypothetical protein
MRVIIEAPLFSPGQVARDPLALLALVHLCLDQECHSVEVEPPEAPEFQEWLGTLPRDYRAQVEFLLDESTERQVREPPTRAIRVADVNQIDWGKAQPRFPLQAALALLRKPLRVLIEGPRDEAFLRSTVPPTYRARFEDWLKRELLKLEYRGGLENLSQALEQECEERDRRLRLCAVFDSDARKRDEPSSKSRNLSRTCKRLELVHHQLQRRAIENYIPEPALERWLKERHSREFEDTWLPKLRAFRQMTPDQRHYFNMKRGLRGDREGGGLSEVWDSLADQLPEVATHLEEGFGDAVAGVFDAHIPDAWLVADGQTAELTQLFEKLLRAA